MVLLRSQPTYEGLKRADHEKAVGHGSLGSQPTYEGLKPGREPAGAGPADGGSQPTYEGLKPAGRVPEGKVRVGSQPTYEGLKLYEKYLSEGDFYDVPSLPMRD